MMIEIVIGLIAGSSFMYHNNEFVDTVKDQREDGYVWVLDPKDADNNTPNITIKREDGKERVLWVLDKPAELQGRD